MNNWTSVKEKMPPTLKRVIAAFKDGTVDIISAIRKQIAVKPDIEGDGYDDKGELIYDTGYCPTCRHVFEIDYDTSEHCPKCGQALDWSDVQ